MPPRRRDAAGPRPRPSRRGVAAGATKGRVTAFAVSIEAPEEIAGPPTGELVFQLLCNPDAAALAGAELAVSGGWIGLRSHPRVVGSVTYGGPAVPSWLDVALRDIVPAAGNVARDWRTE